MYVRVREKTSELRADKVSNAEPQHPRLHTFRVAKMSQAAMQYVDLTNIPADISSDIPAGIPRTMV